MAEEEVAAEEAAVAVVVVVVVAAAVEAEAEVEEAVAAAAPRTRRRCRCSSSLAPFGPAVLDEVPEREAPGHRSRNVGDGGGERSPVLGVPIPARRSG